MSSVRCGWIPGEVSQSVRFVSHASWLYTWARRANSLPCCHLGVVRKEVHYVREQCHSAADVSIRDVLIVSAFCHMCGCHVAGLGQRIVHRNTHFDT